MMTPNVPNLGAHVDVARFRAHRDEKEFLSLTAAAARLRELFGSSENEIVIYYFERGHLNSL
jgi:hypothetical protein